MNSDPSQSIDARATLANWRTAPFNRWAFHHVSEIVPSAVIWNDPARTTPFETSATIALPEFEFDGKPVDADTFLKDTYTDGLVVIHQGQLLHETYTSGMQARDPHILMSVSKSLLGLLAGILAGNGAIDLSKPVEHYIAELSSTGFAGASLQQLLDMRCGVTFDEDYLATSGKIIEYRKSTNWNPLEPGELPADLNSFFLSLQKADGPHGGKFDYKSPCTDLLGWVIERATSRPYADLFSEHIWSKLGAEQPAMITVDRLGAPRVAGGMSVTTRDLARIGVMVANGGAGIVPSDWIDDIEGNGDPDAWNQGNFAEYFPGIPMHYRSKWYVMRGESPVLFCLGIHGQNLFVDRKAGLVMAKHASAPEALDTRSELMAVKLFQTIRDTLPA